MRNADDLVLSAGGGVSSNKRRAQHAYGQGWHGIDMRAGRSLGVLLPCIPRSSSRQGKERQNNNTFFSLFPVSARLSNATASPLSWSRLIFADRKREKRVEKCALKYGGLPPETALPTTPKLKRYTNAPREEMVLLSGPFSETRKKRGQSLVPVQTLVVRKLASDTGHHQTKHAKKDKKPTTTTPVRKSSPCCRCRRDTHIHNYRPVEREQAAGQQCVGKQNSSKITRVRAVLRQHTRLQNIRETLHDSLQNVSGEYKSQTGLPISVPSPPASLVERITAAPRRRRRC